MDTLISMRVFAHVVEAGSFTAAAERFHISRPMVSKHVDHLEEHLGVRLLHRTTRRLTLTESGREYFERCSSILSDLDEAEASAANQNQTPRGTLRITMPISFSVHHMGRLISSYAEKYPEVRIELFLSDQRSNLIDEGLDLAIRIGPPQDVNVRSFELAIDRLVVCGAPKYFEIHGIPRHPSELANHTCLLYSHSTAGNEWLFTGINGVHNVRVAGRISANNGDLLTEIVKNGSGLIRMPLFIIGDALKSGELIPVLTDYESEPIGIYAIPSSKKLLTTKVRSFIEFIIANKHLWMNWQ